MRVVTFYMFKTNEAASLAHNAWHIQKINPAGNWRQYLADGVVVKQFQKSITVKHIVCPAHTKMTHMYLTHNTYSAHTPGVVNPMCLQEIQLRPKKHLKVKDSCALVEMPGDAHASGCSAEPVVRLQRVHFRPQQLSQGVLVALCKMFCRVTTEQVHVTRQTLASLAMPCNNTVHIQFIMHTTHTGAVCHHRPVHGNRYALTRTYHAPQMCPSPLE